MGQIHVLNVQRIYRLRSGPINRRLKALIDGRRYAAGEGPRESTGLMSWWVQHICADGTVSIQYSTGLMFHFKNVEVL